MYLRHRAVLCVSTVMTQPVTAKTMAMVLVFPMCEMSIELMLWIHECMHEMSEKEKSEKEKSFLKILAGVENDTILRFKRSPPPNERITMGGFPFTLVIVPSFFANNEDFAQMMRDLSYAVVEDGCVVEHVPDDGGPTYTVIVLYKHGLTTDILEDIVEGKLTSTVKRQSEALSFLRYSVHFNVNIFRLANSDRT